VLHRNEVTVVRKIWLVLAILLLVLSLLGNLWLWSMQTDLQSQLQQQEQQKEAFQQRVDDQTAEIDELQRNRESLLQQITDLEEEAQHLEESLNNCQVYDDDLLEQLDRLEAEIRSLRRLVPLDSVDRTFLSQEDMRLRLENLFTQTHPPEKAATAIEFWILLELLEPGVDPYSILSGLYSEQDPGFYELQEQQLYLDIDLELELLERLGFVQLYVRALQDQLFDLSEQVEAVSDDADRAQALEALAKGDAFLARQQYLLEHQDELARPELFTDTLYAYVNSFSRAPEALEQQLTFPYNQGLAFVLTHYERRGWASVDDLWGDPPQSTEQILHPDRYPDDAPELVTMPALTTTLGAGWRLGQEDTLGEFMLRLHLGTRLEEDVVEEAATGWGGDRYALFVHAGQDQVLLALHLSWDDEEEANEFVQAYQDYADDRYITTGEGDIEEGIWWTGRPGLLLQQDEEAVKVIYAPSEDLARSVARRLR
jgi:cell division protein FtsB